MSTAWMIAFTALTAVVAALGVLLLGLMHRTMETLQHVETILARTAVTRPSGPLLHVGDRAPPFPGGADVDDNGSVVVFLEAGCEPCHLLAADLTRGRYRPAHESGVLVLDNPEAFHRLPDGWTVVSDPSHELQATWHAEGTPQAYVVDTAGSVTATGHPNTTRDLRELLGDVRKERESRRHRHEEVSTR